MYFLKIMMSSFWVCGSELARQLETELGHIVICRVHVNATQGVVAARFSPQPLVAGFKYRVHHPLSNLLSSSRVLKTSQVLLQVHLQSLRSKMYDQPFCVVVLNVMSIGLSFHSDHYWHLLSVCPRTISMPQPRNPLVLSFNIPTPLQVSPPSPRRYSRRYSSATRATFT